MNWIYVESSTQLDNGIYEIENCNIGFDSELKPGQIEVYDHPIRGQSYWDEAGDDGSDFSGHSSTFWLSGARIRKIQ